MPVLSFTSVFIIGAIAVGVPVLLGLAPRLRVPGAVLEIVAGIVAGPSVLGWVRIDPPVQVLSDLGRGMRVRVPARYRLNPGAAARHGADVHVRGPAAAHAQGR